MVVIKPFVITACQLLVYCHPIMIGPIMETKESDLTSKIKELGDVQSFEITSEGEYIPVTGIELLLDEPESLEEKFDNNYTHQSHETYESVGKRESEAYYSDPPSNTSVQDGTPPKEESYPINPDAEYNTSGEIVSSELDVEDKSFEVGSEIHSATQKSSLSALIESEKDTLETKLSELLSPYITYELTFLQTIPNNITLLSREIEEIHQRLLFILEEEKTLSEKTYLSLGYYYFMTYRNYEGIKLIEPHVQGLRQVDFFYNLLGNFYYNIGIKDKGKEYYLKAIQSTDSLAAPHFSLAYIYVQEGDHHKALNHLNIGESQFLENSNFLILSAECYEAEEMWEQAFFYYEKYLSASEKPKDPAICKAADIAYRLGQFQKALHYFDLAQKSGLSISHLAHKKSICYIQTDQKREALKQLAGLLNESEPQVYDNLSQGLFNSYLKAYKLGIYDSYTFQILESLADELQISYQTVIAKEIHPKDIEDPDTLILLAKHFLKKQNYQEGIEILKRVLEAHNKHPAALRELGKIYYTQEELKRRAIKFFLYLENKKKTDGEIDFYLGLYYFELKRWKKSARLFEQALGKDYKSLNVYEFLGNAYTQLNQFEQAKMYFQKALELKPNQVQNMVQLGRLYLNEKHYQEAITILRQALDIDQNNKEGHLYLSSAYKLILENESEKHYSKYMDLN